MNLPSILLLALIAAWIIFAVRHETKRKKNGCYGCEGCDGHCSSCHIHDADDSKTR